MLLPDEKEGEKKGVEVKQKNKVLVVEDDNPGRPTYILTESHIGYRFREG